MERASDSERLRQAGRLSPWERRLLVGSLLFCLCASPLVARGADLNGATVLAAISRGQRALTLQQGQDGSWSSGPGKADHTIGITSLAVMALLNSGMKIDEPPVRRGLQYLRGLPSDEPSEVYDVSLMLMALVAAKDPQRSDAARIASLAQRLEETQSNQGGWSYSRPNGDGDPSNTQFAILGLREAVEAGVRVNPLIWERSREYWESRQNADGGWAYAGGGSGGSMTVAGVASLAIIQQMQRNDIGVAPDGTPPCCQPEDPYPALERGLKWLATHFAAGHNPGNNNWLLYYLYGIERAGRLSGRRFFGEHDWYREGAAFLLLGQDPRAGHWRGVGPYEGDGDRPVVGTALSLLFLSKGLAPVMMGKLKHGPRDRARPQELVSQDWNQHPRDVRNFMEHVSGLPRWPTLLTAQEVDLQKAAETTGVDALLQAPILFITGAQKLQFNVEETTLLKEYVTQGGFLFACPTCQPGEFESSFKKLVEQLVPPGEGELKLLPPDHPVYRSEYALKAEGMPLYGVDVGCRTSIIYAPEDLGCLWGYWQRHDPPKRNPQLKLKIERALRIGVNVAAYATGREPPKSLDAPKRQGGDSPLDEIQRGLLQVAQLKHTGQWNAAPRALSSLLKALNETVGLAASTKPRELLPSDPNLFQYPLLYAHGRNKFSWSAEERAAIRLHLSRGGLLFADACCASKPFDKSLRDELAKIFPDQTLKPIPVTHELFTEKIGHDVRKVKRRILEADNGSGPLAATIRDVEPLLEGLEFDGRLVVIYSKFDLSCALERQSTLNCEGYVTEDAVKLATNIVLYALSQEIRLPEGMK